MTLTSGDVDSTSRVAEMPSRSGMRTSMSTTSGSGLAPPRAPRARRGLADDLDRVVAREHRLEAGAHEVVVVHEQDADPLVAHAPSPYGRRARRRNAPLSAPASSVPPSSCARSRRRSRARRRRACERVGRGRVGHGDLERAGGELDRHVGAPAVPGGVRKRLLQDPVGRLVDGRAQGPARPLDGDGHVQPEARERSASASSAARPGGGSTSPGGRSSRSTRTSLVDLVQRVARDLLDRLERHARAAGSRCCRTGPRRPGRG